MHSPVLPLVFASESRRSSVEIDKRRCPIVGLDFFKPVGEDGSGGECQQGGEGYDLHLGTCVITCENVLVG